MAKWFIELFCLLAHLVRQNTLELLKLKLTVKLKCSRHCLLKTKAGGARKWFDV